MFHNRGNMSKESQKYLVKYFVEELYILLFLLMLKCVDCKITATLLNHCVSIE